MEYSFWWATLGAMIILAALRDFCKTTLSIGYTGWFSSKFSRSVRGIPLAIHRRHHSHTLLAAAGPVMMLMLVVMWFCLSWAGWALVFSNSWRMG